MTDSFVMSPESPLFLLPEGERGGKRISLDPDQRKRLSDMELPELSQYMGEVVSLITTGDTPSPSLQPAASGQNHDNPASAAECDPTLH
jgi:hypothetical protein